MENHPIAGNPQDPLRAGPPPGQVLLERFGRVAQDFPMSVVIDAAANLLINAVRQSCPKRIRALSYFDELFGKSKTVLDAHYDRVTGDRRNVFAHTQHVILDTHRDPEGL